MIPTREQELVADAISTAFGGWSLLRDHPRPGWALVTVAGKQDGPWVVTENGTTHNLRTYEEEPKWLIQETT